MGFGKRKLHLKNDIVFKAVYGRDTEECKRLLIAMLNLILDRRDDPIIELEYRNPFHIPENDDEKGSILDIKVRTSHNELIDIEMQLGIYDYPIDRMLYYHGGSIRESLKKGETYDKMLKTITICIVDGVLFKELDQFLNIFELRERNSHFRLTDKSAIYYIELPKVNQHHKAVKNLTPLELCLEYLNCASEETCEYVEALIAQGGKELEMVQHVLEKTTQEELLREKALAREKWLHDMSDLEYRHKKWEQERVEEDRRAKEREKTIQKQEQAVQKQEQAVQKQEQAVQEQKQQVQESAQQLEERERVLKEKEAQIDAILKEKIL